jgi:hypothetical protein
VNPQQLLLAVPAAGVLALIYAGTRLLRRTAHAP